MEARTLGGAPSRGGSPLALTGLGDERLARLVASGNERAFVALHRRYHQPLYRYCRSLLRDEQDAQDALQATLAAAFTALREARRDAPLRPWLFRIAHNESISLLRRRRQQDELSDALPALGPGVEQRAEERERLQQLVDDLGELPERQRAALIMRELSGLSHEEIGMALGTTTGTAKQAIFEARQALSEFQEGRAMSCAEVCRRVSDGDRRVLRGRKVRAHLRQCSTCRAFAGAISTRSADLRALTPVLPAGAAATLLGHVLGSSAGGGSGSGSGGLLVGATGKATLTFAAPKLAAGLAVLGAASAGVVTVAQHSHPSAPAGAMAASRAHAHGAHGARAAHGAHGAARSGASGGATGDRGARGANSHAAAAPGGATGAPVAYASGGVSAPSALLVGGTARGASSTHRHGGGARNTAAHGQRNGGSHGHSRGATQTSGATRTSGGARRSGRHATAHRAPASLGRNGNGNGNGSASKSRRRSATSSSRTTTAPAKTQPGSRQHRTGATTRPAKILVRPLRRQSAAA